jgi:hypothetical protein
VLPHDVQLTWYNRKGMPIQMVGPPGPYAGVDVASNGRVAVHRHDGEGKGVVIVIELDGGLTPITSDPADDSSSPVFSPDGRRVAFAAKRDDNWGLYLKSSDGTGAAELLYESPTPKAPMCWYANTLQFWSQERETGQNVWQISTGVRGVPSPLLNTRFTETHTGVPEQETWMTYLSDRDGQGLKVYVQLLAPGAKPQSVSPGGGVSPRVRRDGTEVFYLPGFNSGRVLAVSVRRDGDQFSIGPPVELFEAPIFTPLHNANFHGYGVHPDGQRFLMPVPLRQTDDISASQITIVDDWLSLIDDH